MPRESTTRATLRRHRLVLGIVVGLSAPTMALAQEAGQAEPETPPPGPSATTLDTIMVTGSRIRRAGFDTLEPASVVTKQYIDERGITNIADALNEAPGFGVGNTPEGGQASFGVGHNFVNRFGLGSNRTLTVVNGRRFVSSNPPTIFGPAAVNQTVAPGVQVDLNVIPAPMIERIENLAIGGAPTYGSDAIAGTVNVILRKDFEGAEFGTNYGVTERGDNNRFGAWALVGFNFGEDDRGNLTMALNFDNVDGVLQRERSFFRDGYFSTTNPLASQMASLFPGRTPANDGRWDPNVPFNTGSGDGIPNGVLIQNRRIWTTPFGGLISPLSGPFRAGSGNLIPNGFGLNNDIVLAFDPSGNLVPYNPGMPFSAVDASGGDGLDLAQAGQLTSDLRRINITTTGRFNLTDNVSAFMEGTFYSSRSRELADQWMYNAPLFGGLSQMITFPSDHPMLTDQARNMLASLGVPGFNLSKASRDLVENNAWATMRLSRVVFGLEGSFEFADRSFYWEASYNHGRSDSRYFGTQLIQQNFVNALNVIRDGQGNPVCAGTAIPGLAIPGGNNPVADPNCVPLDMFGDGRPSAAARDYITTQTESQALLEQEVFNINLSSTLLEMWSGPLLYNIGYEHRVESGLFDPGDFMERALGRSAPITPVQGKYSTDEWFGEMVIPLVNPDSDIPFLKKVELVGKYRQVDNTINGKFDAYTYGMQWKPFNDLELRGNITQSLRAPAITEVFLPQATSFQFVTNDPCDRRFINSGANVANRQRNCQAFLSYYGYGPEGFDSVAHGASIQGISGGNPNLANESADSRTFGFTWAPSFLPGLALAADYYKIRIDGVISSLTASEIATACFDSADFNASDVPNANSFCSLIPRTAPGSANPGQATTFISGFVNGRYYNMEAYSAELSYWFNTDRFGRYAFTLSGYFPRELTLDNTGVSPNPAVDEIGMSRRQYQLNTNWNGEKLGLNLSVNYQSGAAFNVLDSVEARDILRVGDYWLLNGGVSYQLNDKAVVRLAVTNLLDEAPPFPAFGGGIGNYDILGRRYNVAFEWKY